MLTNMWNESHKYKNDMGYPEMRQNKQAEWISSNTPKFQPGHLFFTWLVFGFAELNYKEAVFHYEYRYKCINKVTGQIKKFKEGDIIKLTELWGK